MKKAVEEKAVASEEAKTAKGKLAEVSKKMNELQDK